MAEYWIRYRCAEKACLSLAISKNRFQVLLVLDISGVFRNLKRNSLRVSPFRDYSSHSECVQLKLGSKRVVWQSHFSVTNLAWIYFTRWVLDYSEFESIVYSNSPTLLKQTWNPQTTLFLPVLILCLSQVSNKSSMFTRRSGIP